MTLPRSSTLALLALLLPSTAFAADAVVPPLVAKGVDPLVNLNLTSLISSEADFLGVFDNVNQLETAPATLNTACLASTACLYKIAKDNNAVGVIAGQAIPGGGSYEFKLLYYDADKNRIVRSVSFTLPDSPADIADGMGGYVKEVVTGTAPARPESATLTGFDDADLYEDEEDAAAVASTSSNSRRIPTSTSGGRALTDSFDEEDEEDAAAASAAAARAKAEADARRRAEEDAAAAARVRAEAEARRRADEEAAAAASARARTEAEAKRRAEEEAAAERARAAADARRRAEEEEEEAAAAAAAARRGPTAAVAQADEEEDDFENFTLSSSTTVVAANAGSSSTSRPASTTSSTSTSRTPPPDEDEDDLDFLAEDSRSSSPARTSSSSSSSSSSSRSASSSSSYDDLDEVEPRSSSRSSSSRTSSDRSSSDRSSSTRVDRDEDKDPAGGSVLLAGRLGFAPYQGLGFVTYGAEVGYLVTGGLAIAGGIEAYSVQRTIPPEQLEPGESVKQWNTILPLNIGLQYHIGQSKVRPYLGAEMLVVPGIVRGSSTPAMGARGRLGANFFVADAVALNLNGAIGFLGGKDITTIEDGMDNGAVSPQVSGGTVLFF